MKGAPTVAHFEASLGLAWFFELDAPQRQVLINITGLSIRHEQAWSELSGSSRLALASAALMVCELAQRLALDFN